jgi:hypothetical protein
VGSFQTPQIYLNEPTAYGTLSFENCNKMKRSAALHRFFSRKKSQKRDTKLVLAGALCVYQLSSVEKAPECHFMSRLMPITCSLRTG